MLVILTIKVLEIKIKILNRLTIKFRKHAGATGGWPAIFTGRLSEGRRELRRRPLARLRRTMFAMTGSLIRTRWPAGRRPAVRPAAVRLLERTRPMAG